MPSTASSSARRSYRSEQSSSAVSAQHPPALPSYEPLNAPLSADGKRALAGLLQSHSLTLLKSHIQHAAEKLTESAAEVNESATDAQERYAKRQRLKRESAEEAGDNRADEEYQGQLAKMKERANTITRNLEESLRGMIDVEVRLGGLTDGVQNLEREENDGTATKQTTRRGPRAHHQEDDEGQSGGEEEDGEEGEGEPVIPPSKELDEKVERCQADWQSLSLAERYSKNNAYIGFYRVVHDAKYPDDGAPPLPHPSTWFSHLEDTATVSQSSQHASRPTRTVSPVESDDIAIERERVSLKCPLTLLPFRDPVTSTKCPHSFEREAIESMLSQSKLEKPVPGAGRRNRTRYIKCPVCSLELTGDDLQSDPVLLRKVRRAEAISQRMEDEEDHGERAGRRITLGSDAGSESESDGESDDEGRRAGNSIARIKQERAASSFGTDQG